jgi:CubicO group peptidase (beta-lactamase class C family)
MAAEVFGPLGMRDTGFRIPAEKGSRVAQGFPDSGPKAALSYFDPTKPRRYHSTANGLVSTALDYWRFAQMLLDRGRSGSGAAVLAPSTVDTMLSDSLTGIEPGPFYFFDGVLAGFTYGLGIGVKIPGRITAMPGGPHLFLWIGADGTSFFGDRDRELTGIVLTQKPGFAAGNVDRIGTLIMQSAID